MTIYKPLPPLREIKQHLRIREDAVAIASAFRQQTYGDFAS
jgi:hypothetical protein